MAQDARPPATWDSYGSAVRLFIRGVTVPTAARIAVVVGTWLSLMNQGHAITSGHPPWVKLVLNYLTPFVVASLGFLGGRRRRNIERMVALLEEDNTLPGKTDGPTIAQRPMRVTPVSRIRRRSRDHPR